MHWCSGENTEIISHVTCIVLALFQTRYSAQTLKNATSQHPSKAYVHLLCYLIVWKTEAYKA